jgi:hypothetical protein
MLRTLFRLTGVGASSRVQLSSPRRIHSNPLKSRNAEEVTS